MEDISTFLTKQPNMWQYLPKLQRKYNFEHFSKNETKLFWLQKLNLALLLCYSLRHQESNPYLFGLEVTIDCQLDFYLYVWLAAWASTEAF